MFNLKDEPVYIKTRKILSVSAGVGAVVLKALLSVFLILVFTGVICFAVFGLYVKSYLLPKADNLNIGDLDMSLTTVIYYTDNKTGEQVELTRLHGMENRVWVNYSDIPQNLVEAVIAIEDERFESHKGVDWKRTLGAAANIILPFRGNFGGSTITQQLVKNITDEDDITIQRKVLEMLRALNLERRYSKEQIMEMYLNTINLSQGCYGVASAAYVYFGKEAGELTLAECACLAGITNSPTYYDPFQNRDNNKDRQELILGKMLELGKITQEEYRQAVDEELAFRTSTEEEQSSAIEVQSYFIDFLIQEVISQLQSEYGYSKEVAYKLLYAGGLTIEATIDPEVQAKMEKIYNDRENFPTVKGTTQLESAMVVYSTDGRLLGIVGGIGTKQGNLVFNRALSKRQTGSSTKPVTVFAPALENGLITPNTVMDDAPPLLIDENGVVTDPVRAIAEEIKVVAWPANSTRTYTGLVTIRNGVAKSINAIAVRVLEMLTPEVAFEFATNNMGLDLVREKTVNGVKYSDIGYASLGLGGYSEGVSLLQLTAAYVPFINEGVYKSPTPFTRVLDSQGNVILDNTDNIHVAISQKTAYYMRSMLESVVAPGGTGTSAVTNLGGFGVAGKTGTTTKNYDRWFVGMTPYYVAGVWYGFDINKEIPLSYNPSVRTWNAVMQELLEDLEPKGFNNPDGLETYAYCLDSGNIPTEACKADTRGSRVAYGKFFPEDAPTTVCSKHQFVNICTDSGKIANAFCPVSTVKKVSMLNLYRYFAVPGVIVADEQYCVHYPGTLSDDILQNYFPAVASSGSALEGVCDIHFAEITSATTWATGTTEWEPPLITSRVDD